MKQNKKPLEIKDIKGKKQKWINDEIREYAYKIWVWKDCVIGDMVGVYEDGKYKDYTYGSEATLNGGYKSVQTSKASKLESIIEFMAKDKNGFVKDNNVLYNGLGGATFEALDKNKIKYEAGGTLPTPFGQAGLVGETGAMNEMDLFAMGGGLPQGVQQYYANTYNPAYPTPHGYAKGGMLEIDTIYDNGGKSADRYTLIDEDGDMYGIGNSVNMYIGHRSEFPSDLSYLGKKVKYENLENQEVMLKVGR